MKYLKLFENFEPSKTREELIEDLISTSTFDTEELEAMTDDELEELHNSMETENWMDELDKETKGGEHWIGGPYNPKEEEEGDEYYESYGFEDFTHADMEDVMDLLEDGLSIKQIAIELDMDISKARQIVDTINKQGVISDEL